MRSLEVLFNIFLMTAQLSKDTDDNTILVKSLKHEVQALKGRCNMFEERCDKLEKAVEDLQSICNTHMNVLEEWRNRIMILESRLGVFKPAYGGEQFEVTL